MVTRDAPMCAPDADEAIRRLREAARKDYAEEIEQAQRGVDGAIHTLTELLGDIDDNGEIASTLKGLAQARGSLRWLSMHGGMDADTRDKHEAWLRAEYESGELPAEPEAGDDAA